MKPHQSAVAGKRVRKPWTEDEDKVVREFYGSKGGKAVAKLLGRSLASVQSRARSIGVEGTKRQWTNREEVYLKYNYAKKTAVEIARKLDRSEESVRAHLRTLGLTEPTSRPWNRDEIEYLKQHYGTVSNQTLADELGRTPEAVQIKGKRLNLTRDIRDPLSEREIKWILSNFEDFSLEEMARKLDCNVKTVGRITRSHGLRHRAPAGPWTDDEEQYLRENYGEKSRKEMSKEIGRTVAAIQVRLIDLGLTSGRQKEIRPWSDDEIMLLKRWYGKKSNREISDMIDRSVTAISNKGRSLDLHRK